MYFTDQNLLESEYLTELKLSFEIQNWSKLKDRAQRVDKKNRVMVINFMYFLLDTAQYQFHFGQDI